MPTPPAPQGATQPLSQLPPQLPPRLPPRGGGVKNTIYTIIGVLAIAGILVAAGIWTLPNLVTDWQVRNQVRAVPGDISGKCESQLVFEICNATLSFRTPAGVVSRDVNYVFTDVHVGDYTARVVADPARPELATTDMALDRLWNRTITLAIGVGLLLACMVLPLVALGRRWRRGRTA